MSETPPEPGKAAPDPDRGANWQRLAGLGFELFGAILGGFLLGLWIDRHYDTRPWGVLVGSLIGLVGGFYNFIRSALEALSSSRQPLHGPKIDNRSTEGRHDDTRGPSAKK